MAHHTETLMKVGCQLSQEIQTLLSPPASHLHCGCVLGLSGTPDKQWAVKRSLFAAILAVRLDGGEVRCRLPGF